jgi:hypothetical protein
MILCALLLVGFGVVLGTTVFRADIAQATGLAQSVTVDNSASNPVPVRVTNAAPSGVVLRSPTSGDRVEAGSPRFYIFDTSALSAVRVGFSSLSGTENCEVAVIIDSFTVREWNISAQFVDVSDVFEVPSSELIVRVETTSVCWALVGAYGLPIA